MAERSLNDPLSGDEIKEIILAEIAKRLGGDCTLTGGLAYGGFVAKFEIKISYLRSLTPPTLVWGDAAKTVVEGEVESAGDTVISTEYASGPSPNIARQDHHLPIPVLVQTPSGPQRRRVPIEKAKQ